MVESVTVLILIYVAACVTLCAYYCEKIAAELKLTRLEAKQRGEKNLRYGEAQIDELALIEHDVRRGVHVVAGSEVIAGAEEEGDSEDEENTRDGHPPKPNQAAG